MRIKFGVRVRGLKPEILLAIAVAREVWAECNETFVITSVTDGRHKEGSLHHTGEAVDLRLPAKFDKLAMVKELRNRLTSEYDVILETDHIHIEYDPN